MRSASFPRIVFLLGACASLAVSSLAGNPDIGEFHITITQSDFDYRDIHRFFCEMQECDGGHELIPGQIVDLFRRFSYTPD